MTDRPPVRILVTGSRHTSQSDDMFITSILRRVAGGAIADGRPVIVVQGECPYGGADRAASRWARNTPGVTDEPHPADWKTHGRKAGNLRNGVMVDAGADICLAFPRVHSVGTWDCIRKAAKAGIHTRIYPLIEEG